MLPMRSCAPPRGVAPSVAQSRSSSRAVAAAASGTHLRRLGSSDLLVHPVGLGTMTWGKQNTEAEAHEQLNYAFERGLNWLDAAEMYPVPTESATQGRTESYVGSWLRGRPRDSVVLATKVAGASERLTWLRDGGRGTRVDRAQIMEAVDKSLRRLGTDYIDLLQIHWPDRYVPLFGSSAYDVAQERAAVPIVEQLRALSELVAAGKVRHIGVSNETSYGVTEWARASRESDLPNIVSIQNSYSLLQRGAFETDLAETCSPRNCNVGLLAYSPLAGGSLTGKYGGAVAPVGARFSLFKGYMERYNKSLAREAVAQYSALARKHNLSPSALALAFVHSRWFVTSTIIGATTMAQLKENIDAFEGLGLSKELLTEVATLYKRFRDPATDA